MSIININNQYLKVNYVESLFKLNEKKSHVVIRSYLKVSTLLVKALDIISKHSWFVIPRFLMTYQKSSLKLNYQYSDKYDNYPCIPEHQSLI